MPTKRTPKFVTKSTKLKMYRVKLTTWMWEGVVVLGGTAQQCQDLIKKKFKITLDVDQGPRGQAFFHPHAPWVIRVESPNDFAALAHEALHITMWILRNRGVGFGSASDETFCYTQEDIIQQVIDQL